MVETEIAGEHVAGGNGNEEIIGVAEAEQLKGDEQGGHGAVGDAAEEGNHAHGRAQGGRKADERSHEAAKGRADEKGGHDLSALIACGDGDGGEQDFQRKGPGQGVPGKGLLNDIHSGSQIVLASDKEGEQDDEKASGNDAQIQILEKAGHEHVHELKHETEQDTYSSAAGGEKNHLQPGGQRKLQGVGRAEHIRLNAQKQGGLPGNQSRADAGNQSGIVHDAHTGNLHGEKGSGHGRAEQSGKGCSHTAHQNGLFILFTEVKQIPDGSSQRRPHLQRRAFPAHRTAEKDGDDGGDEDQEGHFQRDGNLRVDAFNDGIRPVIIFIMKRFIQKHDYQAPCGKQEKQITVRGPESRRQRQTMREGRRDESYHQTGYGPQKKPAQILADIINNGFPVMPDRFHN